MDAFVFAQMRVGGYAMRSRTKDPLRHGCVGQET